MAINNGEYTEVNGLKCRAGDTVTIGGIRFKLSVYNNYINHENKIVNVRTYDNKMPIKRGDIVDVFVPEQGVIKVMFTGTEFYDEQNRLVPHPCIHSRFAFKPGATGISYEWKLNPI